MTEQFPLRFIADSSPCVSLLGMSATQLENSSFQPTNHKRHRKRIVLVLGLLAQSTVVLLLMALGWWGMTTLGSDSLQPMSNPLYVSGCPQADTLEKGSAGGGCSKEGVSHPISSRQPGVGLHAHARLAQRQSEDKALPRTSENTPSTHSS
jgi:hypothetical protein